MQKERKKDILTSFKRPKWPIKDQTRDYILKCCLVFENNKRPKWPTKDQTIDYIVSVVSSLKTTNQK